MYLPNLHVVNNITYSIIKPNSVKDEVKGLHC